MDDSVALRTDRLTKCYGRLTAVNNLFLEIRQGEVFGLLGPNGAGKTTTINMVLGLVPPTSGTIELLGQGDRRGLGLARLRVGAVVERGGFLPYLTGRENLTLFARCFGIRDSGHISEVLEQVRLSDRADAKVRTYSQGMQRRLELAAALVRDPQLLILDEPLNGLDPVGMAEFRELIRRSASRGVAVLISSHWLADIQMICHRVAVLKNGSAVAQGELSTLLKDTGRIRLRIAEPDRCVQILSGVNWVITVDIERDGWVLVHAPAEQSPELLAVLAGQGLYPSEVTLPVSSLEDWYLDITGEIHDRVDQSRTV